jgi:phosphoglycerate dehydrogenase-like enzyme
VIATPHIAGVTDVNLARMFQLLAGNLQRYRRGETPHYLIENPALRRNS